MADPANSAQSVRLAALEAGNEEWTPQEKDTMQLRCVRPRCGRFLGEVSARPGSLVSIKINCKTTECKVYNVFDVWNDGDGVRYSVHIEPKTMDPR